MLRDTECKLLSFKNYRAPYKNLLTGMIVPNDNAEEGVEKLSEVKGAEVIRSEEGRRRRDRNAPKRNFGVVNPNQDGKNRQ